MLDPVIDALATARLTRLVTSDRITRAPRVAFIRAAYGRDGRAPYLRDDDFPSVPLPDAAVEAVTHDDAGAPLGAALIVCPWCVGVWVGLGVAAARRYIPGAWGPISRALALAECAGLLAAY